MRRPRRLAARSAPVRGWTAAATGALLLVLAGGCAAADDTADGVASPSAPPSLSPSPTKSDPAETNPVEDPNGNVQTVAVRIEGGDVQPPPDRVKVVLGQRVRIVVESDVADEIHVHGYELEAEVTPTEPAAIEFVADEPGLFEVETHETGTLLFQLQVQ